MFRLFLLATVPLFSPAWAACESECSALISLLSGCELPPISSVWTDSDTERRNVSGLPFEDWQLTTSEDLGPNTKIIANISQAECLCPDARTEARLCSACHSTTALDSTVDQNKYFEVRNILTDCRVFGYFDNINLTYPSTTLSAMPSNTGSPGDDNTVGSGACNEICGVMQAQASQCDLTALDASELPAQVKLPNETFTDRDAMFLLNRTAAECMCTLPVLRRSVACRFCLARVEEDDSNGGGPADIWERVDQYKSECYDMGYWSDKEWVLPGFSDNEDGQDNDGDDSTDASMTSSPPSSSTDDEEDGAGLVSGGLVPLSSFLTALMFFLM